MPCHRLHAHLRRGVRIKRTRQPRIVLQLTLHTLPRQHLRRNLGRLLWQPAGEPRGGPVSERGPSVPRKGASGSGDGMLGRAGSLSNPNPSREGGSPIRALNSRSSSGLPVTGVRQQQDHRSPRYRRDHPHR